MTKRKLLTNRETIKILSEMFDTASKERERLIDEVRHNLSAPPSTYGDEISGLYVIMQALEGVLYLCTYCKVRVCSEDKNNFYSDRICNRCYEEPEE